MAAAYDAPRSDALSRAGSDSRLVGLRTEEARIWIRDRLDDERCRVELTRRDRDRHVVVATHRNPVGRPVRRQCFDASAPPRMLSKTRPGAASVRPPAPYRSMRRQMPLETTAGRRHGPSQPYPAGIPVGKHRGWEWGQPRREEVELGS